LKRYVTYQEFLLDWDNPEYNFEMTTSGSTGMPKKYVLSRKKMIFAARLTAKAIPGIVQQKMLCALPTNKMGGFMQLVRAKVWKADILLIEPIANPMLSLPINHEFRNISISPMQFVHIVKDKQSWQKLLQFKTILIGGAALSEKWTSRIDRSGHLGFFLTFGMTETYGHFALRHFPHTRFEVVEGVEAKTQDGGQLLVRSEITDNAWLVTHDLVQFSEEGFVSRGRVDNVINSGGVKFQTEEIEALLQEEIGRRFYITGSSDAILGERVTLVVEDASEIQLTKLNEMITAGMGKHASIRHVVEQEVLVNEVTGKMSRKKVD